MGGIEGGSLNPRALHRGVQCPDVQISKSEYPLLAAPAAAKMYSTIYDYQVAWVQVGRVQQKFCLRLAASQTHAMFI